MSIKHSLRFGKRAAVHDHRIPRLSQHGAGLPPPADNINNYAAIADWFMLGNDEAGDCTVAGCLHAILQMATYAKKPMVPTTAEALAAYSAVGGYVPGDDATDNGLYMMGPGGLIEYWIKTGITCGGVNNKAVGALQISKPNPVEWRQAIETFAGLLIGIQLPENVVAGDSVPFIWSDASGPVAGGHEVYLVGAELVANERLYDLISWGQRFRATESFLLACVDEAVCVVDEAWLDATGKNPAGLDLAGLKADMNLLRSE